MYNAAPEPERDETDPLQNHDNINYSNEPLATFNNTTAATGDVNYNYFNSSSSPSTFQQASGNFASFGGGGAPFDNVDISRGPSKFSSGTPFETVHEYFSVSNKKFQMFLDSTTPHVQIRWFVFGFALFAFILRVIFYEGFYVIAYALGIYLLNIFLLFLSPKFDPAMAEDESSLDNAASLFGDDDILPGNTSSSSPLIDEFRPFVRRLPEFKFWYNAMSALCLGLFCTMFSFLDIPVFWPILLMYFVLLFALTMRRQIQHMIKYKYLPFDIGKKAYA